jgi:hypothetical protein
VILKAIRDRQPDVNVDDVESVDRHLSRAQLGRAEIKLSLRFPSAEPSAEEVHIAWIPQASSADSSGRNGTGPSDQTNQS